MVRHRREPAADVVPLQVEGVVEVEHDRPGQAHFGSVVKISQRVRVMLSPVS